MHLLGTYADTTVLFPHYRLEGWGRSYIIRYFGCGIIVVITIKSGFNLMFGHPPFRVPLSIQIGQSWIFHKHRVRFLFICMYKYVHIFIICRQTSKILFWKLSWSCLYIMSFYFLFKLLVICRSFTFDVKTSNLNCDLQCHS